MPAGAVARLGVEGGGKEPLASLSSGPRRVCASEGVQGSGSKGSREGALARPRQVERAFGTTGRSGRDEQMACTAEFGHPPGPRTA